MDLHDLKKDEDKNTLGNKDIPTAEKQKQSNSSNFKENINVSKLSYHKENINRKYTTKDILLKWIKVNNPLTQHCQTVVDKMNENLSFIDKK